MPKAKTKKPEPELLEYLYTALRSEHGVIVSTNDVHKLRAKLYPLRAEDPDLMVLAFRQSPVNPNELWITKNVEE